MNKCELKGLFQSLSQIRLKLNLVLYILILQSNFGFTLKLFCINWVT